MKRVLLAALTFVILLFGTCLARGSASVLEANKFIDEIRKLVVKEFPKAKVTMRDGVIHFEFNVRKYMVHEPLLTGEWQDAHEELGPQRGGIFCDMEFREGDYGGQAAVPQNFDKRYFTTLVMAPYSKKLDHHLYAHLKYPRNVAPEFLKEFEALVNRFEESCTREIAKK